MSGAPDVYTTMILARASAKQKEKVEIKPTLMSQAGELFPKKLLFVT